MFFFDTRVFNVSMTRLTTLISLAALLFNGTLSLEPTIPSSRNQVSHFVSQSDTVTPRSEARATNAQCRLWKRANPALFRKHCLK